MPLRAYQATSESYNSVYMTIGIPATYWRHRRVAGLLPPLPPPLGYHGRLYLQRKVAMYRASPGNTSPKAATPKSCLASFLAACVLPCVCRSELAGKALNNQVRLDFPRERSRHEGVQDAVQPAWNNFGAVFEQTAEALKYALLDAHRFHRHGLRIEAELFEHRCVRKP